MRLVETARLNSLSVRVLLAYVAATVVSVLLMLAGAVFIATTQGDILSEPDVENLAQDLAGMVAFDELGTPVGLESDNDFATWLFESLKQETGYRVLDTSGRVVLVSPAGAAFWPGNDAAPPLQPATFEFTRQGIAMRGATARVVRDGRAWFLQCAVSVRFLMLGYQAFGLPFTGAGIAVFAVVLLVVFGASAFWTLRYALAPLQQVSESAAAISPTSLGSRLHAASVPREIEPLVSSFNRVLQRLEEGYRAQRDFLATAAHELKTPLALIRAQIELMDDSDDRRALLSDVTHMTRQVQQLLLLAEASERQNYTVADVDVRAVGLEAANYLRRMAERADVQLVAPSDGPEMVWSADRGALFTLLKNLLENAVQHAPRGTAVILDVSATAITVRDSGPAVAPEHLTAMFSRFWRGPHRRDHGAGLGLAICAEIATAHGWSLSAGLARPGLLMRLSRQPGRPVAAA